MVEQQLIKRGIKDSRVLSAILKVPRDKYVPEEMFSSAYEDSPLSIGCGQTISQPYIVALMTELLALTGTEKVLEVGTGSGYQTAILAELSAEVYSVERIEKLAHLAQKRLEDFDYRNIHIFVGDGTCGWPEFQPYDAVIVTAAAPDIPAALVSQMNDHARMIIPVGSRSLQTLMLVEKQGKNIIKKDMGGCVFVPLIGKEGWKALYE